ncbi:hypothetical protein OS493_034371 [Desmophyllum pertusum]|uniref:Uncharacterized protein n=1 Tax=Desmophyllum pertusum TaxID=174260 RepID=A0A9W9ZW65_9CNID|nr:hypothetical protein OS493_034371 [Desmophyllum pertusum]
MSTAENDGDKYEERQETDGLPTEDEIADITEKESLDELETEPKSPGVKEELPFTSTTDSNEDFPQNEGEGENDDEKEQEQDDISPMDGELDENLDESSQKSETPTLIDDSGFRNSRTPALRNKRKRSGQRWEYGQHRSLNEETMPDNIEGSLHECENDLDDITEENDISEMKNEDEEDTEQEDEPDRDDEGRESGFLEEQENDNDEDTVLPQYGDESGIHGDREENSQMKNPSFDPQIHSNGDVMAQDDEGQDSYPREGIGRGSQLEDDLPAGLADDVISGSFYGDDDLSSIFSDDGRDMATILQENSILKEAMMQLRNDNPGGFTDTVSETSDEVDDFYMYPYGTGGDNKMQTSKWMADRDLSDARLNEVLREKRDSQAKNATAGERKIHCRAEVQTGQNGKRFPRGKENQRLKRGNPQGKGKTPSAGTKNVDNKKEPPGKGRNGYAIDIAILAKENEKLSEIIDHLHETPKNDPFNDFVDTFDKYVPKDEYIKLENEKLKLETALREKERMLKEQERLMEETKFDLEEEVEILKDSLRKAENKNKEKAKLVSQNDIKMIDIKAKFTEKVSKLESKLEIEISKKIKLESVIVNLKKCNGGFEKEIQDMNNRVQKLQNQEQQMEETNRREIAELQERLRKETEEKNKLGRNIEALLQDLMQLKSKMLEETDKHAREQEQQRASFETEKGRMMAAQQHDNRRLKSELDEEKKRNEQLIRRMAEIPGETIVSVMENTTESGMFESPISDIESGLLERTLQEEQYNEPEKDNIVMDLNDVGGRGENQLCNVPKPLEDNSDEMNKLQRKLLEVTKYNSIIQRRNKEIEEENINLRKK